MMPEYQFGREVTVKLPEPDDSGNSAGLQYKAWLCPEGHGVEANQRGVWITGEKTRLTVRESRAIAVALLAAADYAEHGGDDAST